MSASSQPRSAAPPPGVVHEPLDRLVQHVVALAEGEAHEGPPDVGVVTECADRDADNAGVVGERATERLAVVEPEGANVADDEVRRLWHVDVEADGGEAIG